MKPLSRLDLEKHPCFNPQAKGQYGRIHLPVAPKCNIKCNFCNRKYDCVNESRPGVTSTVLTPEQAAVYLDRVVTSEPRITVAGIAGPGDPFANGSNTVATLKKIRAAREDMMLCVSSNGLAITPHIDDLAEIGVSHVTITVCAVDPVIGARIYSWVKDGKVVYRGQQAARLLLDRQIEAVRRLKQHDITVKINCIVIPGVNDHHVEKVARTMRDLGVDLLNCMAMFPNVDTVFGHIEQPSKQMMERIRKTAERYLPQMRHCTRCRADAVGLLDDDRTDEFRSCLTTCSQMPKSPPDQRPYIGVASREGVLINQHLGEASLFQIWEKSAQGFRKVEVRNAPPAGGGITRWHKLARLLGDCRAVLISGIGSTPAAILKKSGIRPIEATGFIEDGLSMVYENRKNSLMKKRSKGAGEVCTGTGGGCD